MNLVNGRKKKTWVGVGEEGWAKISLRMRKNSGMFEGRGKST